MTRASVSLVVACCALTGVFSTPVSRSTTIAWASISMQALLATIRP